jgi:DNA transformation protein
MLSLLEELVAPLGTFKARRMFGGHGLYLDGTFFGILDDGALFFKVSDQSRALYITEGMGPFTYQTSHGEHALISYWRVPERLYDEPDEMLEWARAAVAVASAAKAAKKNPQSKAKTKAKPAVAQRPAATLKRTPSKG